LYKKYQIEKGKIERETTKLMKEFKFGKEI
jgi:hypothetical protein